MLYSTKIKIWSTLLTVLGLFVFQEVNAQYLDDDIIQHGTIDSTFIADSSFHLWLFLKGPTDTGFQAIEEVIQNQSFVIRLDPLRNGWENDTLFVLGAYTVSSQSDVRLGWIAPGDNGNIGFASEYDLRWSISMINESNWNSANEVTGEPTPDTAGTIQSYLFSKLSDGTYYIAIKARDEAFNWSLISNVVQVKWGVDSSTNVQYMLTTTWNRWNGQNWETGQSGPVSTINIQIGAMPQGEAITIDTDGS